MSTTSMELLFLGTGTSHGIPMIGCSCAVCRSSDPRDRRNRPCAAVLLPPGPPADGRVLLIDAGPELRLAAMAFDLQRVDAVLFTHGHADHIMGLDDIRRYNDIGRQVIPCYGDAETIRRVETCFRYAVQPFGRPNRPSISLEALTAPQEICGVTVQPVPLMHDREGILGYRIGPLAYCTDCSAIPSASREMLGGLELLVIGALRHRPHPGHFNLAQALEVIADLRPARALLTHIAHEIGHAAVSAGLPPNVQIAYDGLRVRV